MTISEGTSLERATEVVADVGVGGGSFILSVAAAWASAVGVLTAGVKLEEAVRRVWQNSTTFTSPTGMKLICSPAHVIPTALVIDAVQASTRSGSYAAAAVGCIETFVQLYYFATSERKQSWGVSLIEGGYRGATFGSLAGFVTAAESDHIWKKIPAVAIGTVVGFALGTAIAGFGHIARSIHVPEKNPESLSISQYTGNEL